MGGKSDDEAKELALRAAFLCDRESGEPLDLKSIFGDAKNYCKKFSGSGNLKAVISEVADSQSIQEAAIKTAFKGLEYVYTRVSDEVHTAQEKYDALESEIEAGFASFSVPKRGTLSPEERSMKAFYELADNAEPWLIRYLGITKKEPQDITGKTYYRVLPLFKLSNSASQSFANPSLVDTTRTDIDLFLSIEVPDVLAGIEIRFIKQGVSTVSAIASAIHKDDDFDPNSTAKLARIIILAIARLLWALSHQVDLKSGLPSTTRRCLDRCSRAQIYINSILNSNKAPCLSNKSKDDKALIDFIRTADDLINDLRHAYATEHLNELNMEDLTNSAYKSLDILTKGIFTLLYRRHDAGEKKYLPDEAASSAIKNDLAAFVRLLKADDSRLDIFRSYASAIPRLIPEDIDFLNTKATTLIDVLIIFCYLPHAHRKELITALNAKQNEEEKEVEWASQLARRLKSFEKRFITPVEYPGEVYRDSPEPFNPHSYFSKSKATYLQTQDKAKLAGQRLIPFLTLLMATHFSSAYALSGENHIELDASEETYLNPDVDIERTGWQQIQAINEQVKGHNKSEEASFSRRMSSFMYDSKELNPQLDVLPDLHDRMRDLAQLLELVFKMHKQLSKNKIFHKFFIECLDWVRDEHTRLGQKIARLKTENKNGVNRYIQEILLPMELDLIKNFKDLQQAAKDSKRVASDSQFMGRVEENSVNDIKNIHKLVLKLFKKDSQLLQLISKRGNHTTNREHAIPSPTISRRSVSQSSTEGNRSASRYALIKLFKESYNSMSYVSKFYSKKGPILTALIAELSLKRVLSEQDLHHYLEILIRIAATYRKTSFLPFVEAKYAETATMESIFFAIDDADTLKLLPFSEVILGKEDSNLSLMSREKIIQALDKRCVECEWERSEDEIEEDDFLGVLNSGSHTQYASKLNYREKYNQLRKQQGRRGSSIFFSGVSSENQSSFGLDHLGGQNSSSGGSLSTEEESRESAVHFDTQA